MLHECQKSPHCCISIDFDEANFALITTVKEVQTDISQQGFSVFFILKIKLNKTSTHSEVVTVIEY